ncbi:endo alpha-1,4 polygalactosaminidase [Sphingomonas sp. RP10(2022)]|uniref:Endo alpha-1,4 polygalactosaminidase n=1 Tax=Sphingomonas liriopis TaxID=2949094 RepID=A0A9X2KPJ5_9SPHN|nr:endo alpha-1,4 polygalactosaminidase [Sphingomonas liriopis]MCP3733947.1 endo alpha-1,4 polygalactosaminidase [Sphingomonas liriopis]
MARRRMLALGAAGLALGLRAIPGASAERAGGGRDDGWRWGVDYGAATDPALARTFRLLVLEPHHARPIAPLRGPGSRLLGYVSLGEVERSRPYFAELDAAGALGPANPNWPDARMFDLRHPQARRIVLERMVPEVLTLGYDGIFIDTIDSVEAMEARDPIGNKGMVAAAATLIGELRARFPRIGIMLNRGYAVLPAVAPQIDYLLAEAMASRWNFAAGTYEMVSDADWQWQAERLRAAQARNPALVMATLDYWNPDEPKRIAALYARERAAGFRPYVATLALDRLIAEPAR